MKIFLIISITMTLSMSCSLQDHYGTIGYIREGYTLQYNFNNPDRVFELDSKLNEISGLCYNKGRDVLYTINDEKGRMYALDKSSGTIIESYDIGKKGDYEGIATVDDKVYITKSNGKITVFDLATQKVIDNLNNKFKVENEIEGLDINPSGELVLACKIKGLKKKTNHHKIYLYSMNSDNDDVKLFLKTNIGQATEELPSIGIEDSKYPVVFKKRLAKHFPSGIAFSNDGSSIYVLSARNNTIAVIDIKSQSVAALIALDTNIHGQPEGITFDNEGKLYISNEAEGGTPVINVYNPVNG